MRKQSPRDAAKMIKHGWVVTLSGTGVNLALGVLYTWSVISGAIPDSWGWSQADKALPYSIACFVFALAMIPAGRLQDKIGPRWVVTIGGVLTGIGCIVASLAGSSLAGFVIGFGLLAGIGIGFGYAAATPAAVKWFPGSRTGMIAGLVVAGFGLASVYIAPLASALLKSFAVEHGGVREMGVSSTMMVFGIAFLIVVVLLAQLIRNPPEGYNPEERPVKETKAKGSVPAAASLDMNWKAMMKRPQFWVLWLMYACGAATGLMLIGIAKKLGTLSLREAAFFVVVVLAVGNAGGRILSGIVSDKIGRQWTMFGAFMLQALMVTTLIFVQDNAIALLLIILVAGANYGANLTLFPSATKDYFGMKNFGMNYGIMFTAWGVGGLVLPRVNGMIIDATGNSNISFIVAGSLMIFAAALTFVSRSIVKKPKTQGAAE
ncbi:MAG: OFA family MFS transporter [Pseudomonadota bacterium]